MKGAWLAGCVALAFVGGCQTQRKAADDSDLTEVSILAPASNMFTTSSPQEKLKRIRVEVKPILDERSSYTCTRVGTVSNEVPYGQSGLQSIAVKIFQLCSYTITMQLTAESSEDVYYEGSSEVKSSALAGKESLQVDISLNVSEAGAAAGFGALGPRQAATEVSGASDKGRQTNLSLASQLGNDSCNITNLVLVDKGETKVDEDGQDPKKIVFASALRLLKSSDRSQYKDIAKSLKDACGPSYASYSVRCELEIKITAKSFTNQKQEDLTRKLTTPAFKIDATHKVSEAFALQSDYEQSNASLLISYCLAKRAAP